MPAKAGYLAKAFRQTGRGELADDILRAMKGAGYDVREAVHLKTGNDTPQAEPSSAPMRAAWR